MSKVLVLAPMEKELVACGLCGKRTSPKVLSIGLGIGRVNTALAIATCVKWKPDIVLCVGCAGALSPSLDIGDVVVSKVTKYCDVYCGSPCVKGQMQGCTEYFCVSEMLINAACESLDESGVGHETGLIVTGEKFCNTSAAANALHREFPRALAVDMESAAVGQVCDRFCIPYLSVRVMSETLNGERSKEYAEFWSDGAIGHFKFVRNLIDRMTKVRFLHG